MTRPDVPCADVDGDDEGAQAVGEFSVAVCCLVVTVDRSVVPAVARIRIELQPDIARGCRRTVNVLGADAALAVVGQWLGPLGEPMR